MPMQGYRLFIEAADGQVQSVVEILCANDEAAIARAEQQPRFHPAELWQGARRVREFAPARPR